MAGKNFPISLIVKAVDKATAPLRQVSAQLGDISKQVRAAGSALTTGVTLPLAGIAAGSVAAFGNFEKGMASVSTLVDTSVESMAAMEEGVIAVTRAVKVQPLAEMSEALATLRGAGVKAEDQFKVLEGSAKLAAAALGTTQEASLTAVGAINAWGLKGKEAEGVYNLLFQATNTGVMTLSQLSQGFGSVAGTMAGAGIQLDEYLASVAALTTTTRPASEAHTQMKAVMAGLTRQTDLTRAVFKKLGAKDIKDLIAKSGGLVPALEQIKTTLKGDDGQMLKLLGSTEALAAALDLTGNQAEAFKGTLKTMRSGVDGMTAAFEKQARTGAASLQSLKNDLEIVGVTIGRSLVPVLQQLVPYVQRAAEWWLSLGEDSRTAIIVMAAAAAALGPTITVLASLATALSAANAAFLFVKGWAAYLWLMKSSILTALIVPLKAAIATVWGFTAALLANPITWVIAGVVALGAAAYLIYKNWEPVKEFFQSLWETIKHPLDALKTAKDFYFGGDSPEPVPPQTPGGVGPRSPVASGAPALLGAGDRPMLGVAAGAPASRPPTQQSESRVVVDFSNLPRGTRVTEAPGGSAPLDLSLGYGMMGG